MFYKVLPYLLIVIASIGIYWFVDDLQTQNQTLTKAKTQLEKTNQAQVEKLEAAEKEATAQLEIVIGLKADFERDQRVARELAEKAAKANAELNARLAKLIEDAKNDPEDKCSFTTMPDHVIGLLFGTDPATSADSDNENRNGQGEATSKPSDLK